MGARSTIQWGVLIIAVFGGFCFSAFAGPVYTYGGEFELRIPSDADSSKGWMFDAVVDVPVHGNIIDIDVSISLTHSNICDLQIFLVSPSGTSVCLNMCNPDEFFQGGDYVNTIFDDEADVPIGQGGPDFTGRFRPRDSLSAFDGEDAYGPWRLQIYDAYYADTGSLGSVQLIITVIEPATAMLLIAGAGLTILIRPRRITYR